MDYINADSDAALEAILAAISHASGGRQVELLQAYLESRIDELEQLDIEFYDFLADTVFLAHQKMQDLRLEVIELRLEDLEHPPFNMRDLVLDLAILVAVELAVILVPHVVMGAAAGIVPTLALFQSRSRAVRKTARTKIADDVYEHSRARAAVDALQEKYNQADTEFREWQRVSRAASQDFDSVTTQRAAIQSNLEEMGKSGWVVRDKTLARYQQQTEQEIKRSAEALREATDMRDQLLPKRRKAMRDLQEAQAKLDTVKQQVDDDVLGKKLQEAAGIKTGSMETFWKNLSTSTRETFHARIAEEAGELGQTLRNADYSVSAAGLKTRKFSPAEVAGDYLQMIRRSRRDASTGYARLRSLVRYTDKAKFLDSAEIQMLTRSVGAASVHAQDEIADIIGMREALSVGIEFMLWQFWLSNSGMLDNRDQLRRRMHRLPEPDNIERKIGDEEKAQFIDNVLMKSISPQHWAAHPDPLSGDIPYVWVGGPGIPMASGFSEHITDYLYKTFSIPYLKHRAGQGAGVDLPFLYDADEQAALLAAFQMDKNVNIIFENAERQRLMKTMAAINTFVFLDFYAEMKTKLPEAYFSEAGKTFGEVMAPLRYDFDAAQVSETAELTAMDEQADTIKLFLNIEEDLRDIRATLWLERHLDEGGARIDEFEMWMSQDVGTDDPYVVFVESQIRQQQSRIRSFLEAYDSPSEGEVAIAVDPAVIERAEQFLRYDPNLQKPIGQGLDDDISSIGDF